ncbi:MAG: hypothetical protein Q4C41_01165 [Eggerthellaceae bacterium]|nr:hypothetical protein [Eggerthellaceae bacterium]
MPSASRTTPRFPAAPKAGLASQSSRATAFAAVAALALFYFAFLGSEFLFDTRMGDFVAASEVVVAQNVALGISVLGFAAFALVARLPRRALSVAAACGCAAAAACLGVIVAQDGAGAVRAAGYALFALLGVAGGAAHWVCAEALAGSARVARCVGAAYAAGLLMQFAGNLLDNVLPPAAAAAVLAAAVVALVALTSRAWPRAQAGVVGEAAKETAATDGESASQAIRASQDDAVAETARETHSEAQAAPTHAHARAAATQRSPAQRCGTRRAVGFAALIVLMTFMFSTLDNIVTIADAQGSLDVETWPRLFLAASGLAAGFVFDARGRRLMGPAMFCVMLLSTLSILAIELGAAPVVGLIVFYVSAGFFVVFFTAGFFLLAPRTRLPQLWAGAGRAANNLAALAFIGPSLALVGAGNVALVMAAVVVLFAVVSALFFALGLMQGSALAEGTDVDADAGASAGVVARLGDDASATGADASPIAPAASPAAQASPDAAIPERLHAFAEEHALTPREADVLAAVVQSEDTLQRIADSLGMSLRMLQRHLSAIYRKTNTQTRAGLTKHFFS